MILVRRVGEVARLALVTPQTTTPPPRSARFAADRALADRAERLAVGATGLSAPACTVSRSHTAGLAAALAAPVPARLGVDVVRLDRVTRRHEEAVADPAERGLLAGWGALAAPLTWALKEAAAKATGDPARSFPAALRIVGQGSGLGVCWLGGDRRALPAGWMRVGDFLCAWVLG